MDGGESDIRQTFLLLLLFYYFIKIFNKKKFIDRNLSINCFHFGRISSIVSILSNSINMKYSIILNIYKILY